MKTRIRSALDQFPWLKNQLRALRRQLNLNPTVSSDYRAIVGVDEKAGALRLRDSWQNSTLPGRQRELVEKQLGRFRAGARVDVFDVFSDALRGVCMPGDAMSLLEIGCSSGFYSEVVAKTGLPISYAGCDYSEHFIAMARTKYPGLNFWVEDAIDLSFSDGSFDIVVSGCCLLHIPEYARAVSETARICSRYAVFHRTPVVWGQPERWYRKKAYGVETVEIHFNESEFKDLLERSGFALVATYTLQEEATSADRAQGRADRTYVCKKITS